MTATVDEQTTRLFAEAVRKAAHAAAASERDIALDELGWRDALTDAPQMSVPVLFEAQGETNATSTALDDVLARGLGIERSGAAVLVPRAALPIAPGSLTASRVTAQGFVRLGEGVERVLITTDGAAGPCAVVVPIAQLSLRPVRGLDPRLGLAEVRADGAASSELLEVSGSWPAALAAGQLALGYQLLGASRTMLSLAVEHARSRVQFGRPVASFQAVRHRLAEALVAIEAAAAALSSATEHPDATGVAVPAEIAKAVAGQSARTTARHAQQTLAGMGFTTEHAFHRYLRRTRVLDQLLGSSTVLTRRIGEQVLAAGALPPMQPL